MGITVIDIDHYIAQAVAAERERCAKVIAEWPGEHCCLLDDDGKLLEQLPCACWRAQGAARIRGGQ